MSCGLGAVILVLMLVKFEQDVSIPEEEQLKADLERLQATEARIIETMAALQADAGEADATIEAVARDIDRLEETIGEAEAEKKSSERALAGLREAVKNIQPQEASDRIQLENQGEETYLIGLKVEGPRIAILVDMSASMTDYRILDIIRRKGGSEADRRQAPKWQRTIATVEWLLARLPADSKLALIAFSETAAPVGPAGWTAASDGGGIGRVLNALRALTPAGATNLEAGLQAVQPLRASNLYIVTDGLPTKGVSGYKSLNPFADCPGLWGGSVKISGACRQRLFVHSVSKAGPPAKVPVNVVLLPLEGDPGAAHLFWLWTAQQGGILISPAPSWP